MYENIKVAFESLIKYPHFQMLVKEYRHRYGIPPSGFGDSYSEAYKNWVNEGLRKPDLLKDQFLFIAKRCKNLIPDRDPIPNTFLAYYFLFGQIPSKSSNQNNFIFSVNPSGILGSFDITFTVPLLFGLDEFSQEVKKHSDEINQISLNAKLALSNLSNPKDTSRSRLNPAHDLLATTPGNGSDIVDRVHRDMAYLVELGRIGLREHLTKMKDQDFVVNEYNDKNKPMLGPVQNMGHFLLNRGLYPIAEEYWKQIDDEIIMFNRKNNREVNRGIPLGNLSVSQLAQGKVIEGLFNLYKAYQNDQETLRHLQNITIDPENDLPNSDLFTQFESRQISRLFRTIIEKYSTVFPTSVSENDLRQYILSLAPDKKILLFITLYRFSFSFELNSELSNPVNRGEILRSLSELALWYEDELKQHDTTLSGTLGNIMDLKVGILNPTSGEFTSASDLNELQTKINNSINAGGDLKLVNARIATCVRNFTGHNFASESHPIFTVADEVMARMISLILYSNSESWI